MCAKITACFCILCFLLFSCSDKPKDANYDIREFGAIGDSVKINTIPIQKAIDKCSQEGGGIVFITKGIYISGTVLLKSNVELQIQEGAKLVGSSNPYDYTSIDTFVDATGQERGNCLIGAINASNIGVTGKGTIDGNGAAFTYDKIKLKKVELNIDSTDTKFGSNRPFLLRFVKSSNIALKNIQLKQPAAWTCHFYKSHDIVVDNVSIYAHSNHNNDGIDLDSSYNVKIINCSIDTGDDAICFKTTSPSPTHSITVTNCVLKSEWGAIKFGTESMGDFYDIKVNDCKIKDTKGGGIKILSVDGANIHDINISNIQMENTDMPIFMRLGERLRTYRDAAKQEVGSINNVLISNVTAITRANSESRVDPPTGIFITGTPNHKIGKVDLKDISISVAGGGNVQDAKSIVAENETEYPEFNFFKILPSYGMFLRHIEGLKGNNVAIELRLPDSRKPVLMRDVEGADLTVTPYEKGNTVKIDIE